MQSDENRPIWVVTLERENHGSLLVELVSHGGDPEAQDLKFGGKLSDLRVGRRGRRRFELEQLGHQRLQQLFSDDTHRITLEVREDLILAFRELILERNLLLLKLGDQGIQLFNGIGEGRVRGCSAYLLVGNCHSVDDANCLPLCVGGVAQRDDVAR